MYMSISIAVDFVKRLSSSTTQIKHCECTLNAFILCFENVFHFRVTLFQYNNNENKNAIQKVAQFKCTKCNAQITARLHYYTVIITIFLFFIFPSCSLFTSFGSHFYGKHLSSTIK